MRIIVCFLMMTLSTAAGAHVKWFSNYDFQHEPLQFTELFTPTFWGLFLLSIVSLPLFVYLDKVAEKSSLYLKANSFLDRYSDQGPLIMRVSMAAVLLMSWQGDSVIAPEIAISHPFWGWFQFALALLLLFKETTPLTGIAMIFLYFKAMGDYGYFHMLDYIIYPAVGCYLIFTHAKNERIKNLDLPVLYSGLGFSLCWVAFEKMIYPYWGLSVLAQHPALTMGLNHEFFLLSCAFIEFTLGYMLIICLLHRPLAVVVTLVFFTTTTFFGKTEIVGHTILHGALLVFIVKGPGQYYQAPIRYHKSYWLRGIFAAVNFIILFVVLAIPYQKLSQKAYVASMAQRAKEAHPRYVVPEGSAVPTIALHARFDKNGGWNIHLATENFTFSPEAAGEKNVTGEGHAHLFVNGKKIARVYGNWFHLTVPKGKNTIKATLTTNNHEDYYHEDRAIEAEIELNEPREVSVQHGH